MTTVFSRGRSTRLPIAAFLFTCGLTGVAMPTASAQIVFDNGGPARNGYVSDTDFGTLSAETFTFTAPTTFDTVQWFGVYAFGNTPPTTDAFTLTFYNTTGGVPNATPFASFPVGNAVSRTPTGMTTTSGGYPIFQYTSTLSTPQALGAGTYGIGIVNNTASDTDDNWYWAFHTETTGTFYIRNSTTAPYTAFPYGDLAFNLQNNATVSAVPEPSEWAVGGMFGATLLFGMVNARRKASRTWGKKVTGTV